MDFNEIETTVRLFSILLRDRFIRTCLRAIAVIALAWGADWAVGDICARHGLTNLWRELPPTAALVAQYCGMAAMIACTCWLVCFITLDIRRRVKEAMK